MLSVREQRKKLDLAQRIIGYEFKNEGVLLSAITHPSAAEGLPVKCSYERLEFLGDSVLGGIVADAAFHSYPKLDEGGLTRIKVSLVSGASLSRVANDIGLADVIIFGLSERGTGKRGLNSALENVYEAIVAALYLDGGLQEASSFVDRTLIGHMNIEMAKEPENPKSVLQERMQEHGITPTYKLVETQGPPHDRTFVTQVFAGSCALASGVGRTKKESESNAAKMALDLHREGKVDFSQSAPTSSVPDDSPVAETKSADDLEGDSKRDFAIKIQESMSQSSSKRSKESQRAEKTSG